MLFRSIVLNTTGNKTKITTDERTVADIAFTHRVVLKGTGNYFAITAKGACTVKVIARNATSNAGDNRVIGLYSDTAGTTAVTGTEAVSLTPGEGRVIEFAVTDAGTYYLESITNELAIYQIEVIYNA